MPWLAESLVDLAGLAGRHYNGFVSARSFSSSHPLGFVLMREKSRHETHRFDFSVATLRRAARLRARLGTRDARKVVAPPRVGHREARRPLRRNVRRVSRIEEQDAGRADHP